MLGLYIHGHVVFSNFPNLSDFREVCDQEMRFSFKI